MPRLFRDPVTIADLSFNSGSPDANGVMWYLDGLDGWDATADPQPVLTNFGVSDGALAGSRFPLKEKYLEVTGVIVGPDRITAERAWRKIIGSLGPDTLITVVRNGPIPEKMATRLSARVGKTIDKGKTFRWATTLVAPWPFKVGVTETVGQAGVFTGGSFIRTYTDAAPAPYRTYTGYTRTYSAGNNATAAGGIADSVTFNNQGNAVAYPVYEIDGPLTASTWTLSNETTGEDLTLAADISTGQTLVIDTLNKTATLAGVPVDFYLRGDWVKAPPGANLFRLITAEPNASARLRVRASDTWR